MKTFEFAQHLKIKTMEAITILTDRGIPATTNSRLPLTDEEAESLIVEIRKELSEAEFQSKMKQPATLFGVVFNDSTQKYERIVVHTNLPDLQNETTKVTILAEHNTIHGAKIELYKDILRIVK